METKMVDDVLPLKYKQYGNLVNLGRAFPSIKDGLKVVGRRVLYTSFLECKNKLTKSGKVVGSTMGKFHPHGDASIYETLVNLTHCGFYDTQGSFGSLSGLEPPGDKTLADLAAAMRYTEVKLKKESLDLIFSLIDYVPFVEAESGEDKEPEFLPVKFPLCFVSPKLNRCMGFGVNATYPNYKFEDLKKRLAWLLGLRKTEPVIKPFYGRFVEVLSKDKDLRAVLKRGEGTVIFKPKTRIISKKEIQILSRPVNLNLRKRLFALFQKDIDEGKIIINDLSQRGNTDVRLVLSSRVNITDVVKKLDDGLTTAISYSCIFVEGDRLVKLSVDDLLLRVFQQYKELWEKKIDTEVALLKEKLTDLEIIVKLRPYIAKILDKKYQWKRQVEELAKASKIKQDDVKRVLQKYSVKTLMTVSTDTKELIAKIKFTKIKKDKVIDEYNF